MEAEAIAVEAQETQGGQRGAVACKHWLLHHQCFFGPRCAYSHPAITQATADRQAAADLAKRSAKRKAGKRYQIRNGSKVLVFRHFLKRVFGADLLRSGAGVLDIAGGKGELAFELLNRDHCAVTVVDPRPLCVDRYHMRFVVGLYTTLCTAVSALSDIDAVDSADISDAQRVLWNLVKAEVKARDVAASAAPAFTPPSDCERQQDGEEEQKELEAHDDAHQHAAGTLTLELSRVSVRRLYRQVPVPVPAHLRLFFTPLLWEHILDMGEGPRCDADNYPKEYARFRQILSQPDIYDHPIGSLPGEELLRCAFRASLTCCWTEKGLVKGSKEEAERKVLMDQSLLTETELRAITNWSEDEAENQLAAIEWEWEAARRLLRDCSVVVGLHPDQATEALVDFCMATGKPFAVVPCCIYSKQFPRRRKVDGTRVRTVEQLAEHLMEKHPAIQCETLSFDGKNTVLYWEGDRVAEGAKEEAEE